MGWSLVAPTGAEDEIHARRSYAASTYGALSYIEADRSKNERSESLYDSKNIGTHAASSVVAYTDDEFKYFWDNLI